MVKGCITKTQNKKKKKKMENLTEPIVSCTMITAIFKVKRKNIVDLWRKFHIVAAGWEWLC
jgi:hypothetical protein